MNAVPLELKEASAYIDRYHRHHGPVVRDKYRIGCEEGHKPGTLVVMLLFAKTDTKWFHEYVLNRAEVRFLKGRVKFGGAVNNAPFPSMIVIFRGPGM